MVAPITAAEKGREDRLRAAGVRLELVSRPRSRVGEVVAALRRKPPLAFEVVARPVLAWQVSVFWASLRAAAARVLEAGPPDVVAVEHDWSAAWADDVPRSIPAVLTFHNVSWRYYERRARDAPRVTAPAFALEAARFRRHVLRHLARYRTLVAVSPEDRDELVRNGFPEVELVPNGVATDEFRPTPEPFGAPTLLFTGTMNYAPNTDGILWFAEHVWPLIRRRHSDARLLVVGRNPPEAVTRLASGADVEVTGAVPDVRPYFARATAVVVPLRSGGGTRLKVLEALAAGRAVVSTSVGAEGLALEPGRHLLVEDDAEGFAGAVLTALADDALRQRVGEQGRALVVERYDWRSLAETLEAVLLDAARS